MVVPATVSLDVFVFLVFLINLLLFKIIPSMWSGSCELAIKLLLLWAEAAKHHDVSAWRQSFGEGVSGASEQHRPQKALQMSCSFTA
jgi:hypothetical protein